MNIARFGGTAGAVSDVGSGVEGLSRVRAVHTSTVLPEYAVLVGVWK